MISAELLKRLTENKIAFKTDYSLKNSSTFRIGGECALAVFPSTAEQLALALSVLDGANLSLHICGKGSNTLFFDGRTDTVMVFTSGIDFAELTDERVRCGAGVGLVSLAALCCREGLSGLEFASGIPGSVGGAVFMNAGAYGSCMDNIVVSSLAYNRADGKILKITEHAFGYRKSIYKSNPQLVCLEAELKLKKGNIEEIKAELHKLGEERRRKQPLEYPSAGSYFKRPEGDFAGRLIEACGLKGERIGDACVSEKHAGFIVNLGNASFADVMHLEERVREAVFKGTGVELEREVEIVW